MPASRTPLASLVLARPLVLRSSMQTASWFLTSDEVDERPLQVGERLLQRLGVHVAQPSRLGLVLERREPRREHASGQRLARLVVVLPHLVECPVPHPAPRARELRERALLVARGLQAKAVGAVQGG